jgi:hypothetical protein
MTHAAEPDTDVLDPKTIRFRSEPPATTSSVAEAALADKVETEKPATLPTQVPTPAAPLEQEYDAPPDAPAQATQASEFEEERPTLPLEDPLQLIRPLGPKPKAGDE